MLCEGASAEGVREKPGPARSSRDNCHSNALTSHTDKHDPEFGSAVGMSRLQSVASELESQYECQRRGQEVATVLIPRVAAATKL